LVAYTMSCWVEFGYQWRIPEQFREWRRARFFRPLLYQLSYLGESSSCSETRDLRAPVRAA